MTMPMAAKPCGRRSWRRGGWLPRGRPACLRPRRGRGRGGGVQRRCRGPGLRGGHRSRAATSAAPRGAVPPAARCRRRVRRGGRTARWLRGGRGCGPGRALCRAAARARRRRPRDAGRRRRPRRPGRLSRRRGRGNGRSRRRRPDRRCAPPRRPRRRRPAWRRWRRAPRRRAAAAGRCSSAAAPAGRDAAGGGAAEKCAAKCFKVMSGPAPAVASVSGVAHHRLVGAEDVELAAVEAELHRLAGLDRAWPLISTVTLRPPGRVT